MFYRETDFKQTAGGEIPSDWGTSHLGDLATVKGRIGWRGLKASEYTSHGPYLIANKHISNNIIDWENCDHISEFRYKESPEIQLLDNDVIMSKDGTIGEAAFVDRLPSKATINSTMMLLRVTSPRLHPLFVFYYLQGRRFKRFIGQKKSGTSIPHLFQADMNNLWMVVPRTKKEQSEIVEVLSTVDQAIQKTSEIIAKTERLKKGLMQELLTKGIAHSEFKETETGRIPKEWGYERLDALCEAIVDCPHSTPEFTKSGVPIIRNFNIRDGI